MLDKINFQRGSVVTPDFLNEIQTPINFSGSERNNYYSSNVPDSWFINQRDKIKEWEIDESGTGGLSRLSYQGRILGYTTSTDSDGSISYNLSYGPPRTSIYPLDQNGEIDLINFAPANNKFIYIEKGSIQGINGNIISFPRQSLLLPYNNNEDTSVEYYIFYDGLSEEIGYSLANTPPASGEAKILLAKLTLDFEGNIQTDIETGLQIFEDLRQNSYISSLFNYSSRLINNNTVQTGNYVLSSWERIFIDTSENSFVIQMPLEPQDGDKIALLDYSGSFNINPLIIRPNLNNEIMIHNSVEDWVFNVPHSYIELFYVEEYKSWFFHEYPIKTPCNYKRGDFISCGEKIFDSIKPAGLCPHSENLPIDSNLGISPGVYFYNDETSECYWDINIKHAIYSDGLNGYLFEPYAFRCGATKTEYKNYINS